MIANKFTSYAIDCQYRSYVLTSKSLPNIHRTLLCLLVSFSSSLFHKIQKRQGLVNQFLSWSVNDKIYLYNLQTLAKFDRGGILFFYWSQPNLIHCCLSHSIDSFYYYKELIPLFVIILESDCWWSTKLIHYSSWLLECTTAAQQKNNFISVPFGWIVCRRIESVILADHVGRCLSVLGRYQLPEINIVARRVPWSNGGGRWGTAVAWPASVHIDQLPVFPSPFHR